MVAPLSDDIKIPYSPALGKFLGARSAIFLQQIWYFQTITDYELEGKKFFYRSDKEWSDLFGWDRSTFIRMRGLFIAAGILDVRQLHSVLLNGSPGGPLWYHLDRARLDSEWTEFEETKVRLANKYKDQAHTLSQKETGVDGGKIPQPMPQNAADPCGKMQLSSLRVNKRFNKDSLVSSQTEETSAPDSDQFELVVQQDGIDPDDPEATWQDVVRLYNEICTGPGFSVCLESHFPDSKSFGALNDRMKKPGHRATSFWKTFFQRANASDFLSGRNGRMSGKVSIHFLLTKQKFINVWEGVYDNRV